MQRPDITEMQNRLQRALANDEVRALVRDDLIHTFTNLGIHADTRALVDHVITSAAETSDIEMTEKLIYSKLKGTNARRGSILDLLEEGMKERAHIIYRQVSKFFCADDSIVDFGCGDGQVTNHIYNHITHDIKGFDIRHYPAQGVMAPITQFNGVNIGVRGGYYSAGLMTNVAHHAKNNAPILTELARIIRPGGRLVVIETVPLKPTPAEIERTFVNDWAYNRLFHQADVPVPGTYETTVGWVRRFSHVGFSLEEVDDTVNPTLLGYDQPTIRDCHVRIVFRRDKIRSE